MHHLRPDLVAAPFRGNVPRRVEKCIAGEVDAIVLARAGLARLGLSVAPLVAFDLDPRLWVPAPAQGALGIEIRESDAATREQLSPLSSSEAEEAVGVERGLLALLEAGCHAALGAWARRDGDAMALSTGALGGDGLWRAVELSDRPDDLVTRAARALEDATPAAAPGTWWSDAVPW